MVASHLPEFPVDITDCLNPLCTLHHSSLDLFCDNLARCLYDCAEVTIPKSHPSHSVPGWNSSARLLKEKANFWHVVWKQAGSPSAGVLHQLKKSARSRYKYEVRRLKCREHHIRRKWQLLLLHLTLRTFGSMLTMLTDRRNPLPLTLSMATLGMRSPVCSHLSSKASCTLKMSLCVTLFFLISPTHFQPVILSLFLYLASA